MKKAELGDWLERREKNLLVNQELTRMARNGKFHYFAIGDVDNKMRIAQEEIFGPVVVVIPYTDTEDALAIANDNNYGLSGSVWTADVAAGLDVARGVRTGTYPVNGFGMDWGSPFGGFKDSGLGRELGPEGLEEYLEYKSINLPAGTEPELRF